MLKRAFLVGAVLLLTSLIVVGCGVPQEEHDAAVAERDAAKSQIVSLQSELAATQSDLAATANELATTQSDLAEVEGDLAAAKSNLTAAQQEIRTLQGDYETVSTELAAIKEVYPPRDFSSLKELQDWLVENDVSESPEATYAETLYGKGLEIQEDAINDGYLISVNLEYDETADVFYVTCVAIIDGDIWWWDVEADEPIYYEYFQKVK